MSHAAETAAPETPEGRASLLAGPRKLALVASAVGFLAFGGLGALLTTTGDVDIKQFLFSYLVAFTFWVSIGLGSIFFLCVQYVTGGRWGILLRRALEANAKTFVTFGFVLALPLIGLFFAGEYSPYWWGVHAAHHETPEAAPFNVKPTLEADEEAKMHDWLNPKFAAIRVVAYFAIFGLLVFWMNKLAMTAEYDANEEKARKARAMQKVAASVGLFVFAIVLTFIATDWIMSLEETFASSMFPVIMFDNAAVTAYCIGMITLLYLKEKGHPKFVNLFPAGEQVHLGSLLLAFTLAWTYFNFSQYMLIWIGNLPEEIPYYLKRRAGGWKFHGMMMVVFHFPVPFLLLLFRHVKSNPTVLKNICIGLLLVCLADVIWWIEPTVSHVSPGFLFLDLAAWLAVGGLWVWFFLGQLKKHPLLPSRETYLLEAYHHGH